ncbi:Fe-S cluster assembly protein SufD [Lujinxingia vulgaris]|uniref:Fe-S cluster assembly protein SufD n=1 Tax=Lujinxingia vulgaris TaxID=2600176 RepID=A0A5C6XDG1_9DELT|nr:Fe-S cluster assembly protein SufD [Lujinxingia vulgaris]TXD39411.1 Fe-S cluster assembly protein SufD [Lujinxingia vulgaris]
MSALKNTTEQHPFIGESLAQPGPLADQGLPGWWAALRTESLGRITSIDVPTSRHEEWRFIKPATIFDTEFISPDDVSFEPDDEAIDAIKLAEDCAATLVYINGRFDSTRSSVAELPEGVVIADWSQILDHDQIDTLAEYVGTNDYFNNDVFYEVNTAQFGHGAVVLVPRGKVVEKPIHLLFLTTGEKGAVHANPRNLIVAGESAQLTVVEEYRGAGEGAYLNNVVDEVIVGANADVKHFKVQRESTDAFHVARNLVTLSQDARYISTAVTLGAALSRNDSYARYVGQNIDCTLDGLALVRGNQVADTHTAIDHALPNSRSYQLHKTIVDDRAHTVFNGKIFVREDAQNTRSEQLNQNLILSARGHVDTKPQLEILADDVVCSHGATVGQLEDEQLFYLQSRGIDEAKARNLLTFAFAAEVIETITVASVRESLADAVIASTDTGL